MVPPVMIHLGLAIHYGNAVTLCQQQLPAPCGAPLWWLGPQRCVPLMGPTFPAFQLILSCAFCSSNPSTFKVQSDSFWFDLFVCAGILRAFQVFNPVDVDADTAAVPIVSAVPAVFSTPFDAIPPLPKPPPWPGDFYLTLPRRRLTIACHPIWRLVPPSSIHLMAAPPQSHLISHL